MIRPISPFARMQIICAMFLTTPLLIAGLFVSSFWLFVAVAIAFLDAWVTRRYLEGEA